MPHSPTDLKNSNLSRNQRKALPILAASPSISEAARLSKVDRSTLYRWLEDENFRAELAQLQQKAAGVATANLQGLTLQAVQALAELLESPVPNIRLRAVRTILSYAIKLRDVQDLANEVQTLLDAIPLKTNRGEE